MENGNVFVPVRYQLAARLLSAVKTGQEPEETLLLFFVNSTYLFTLCNQS